MDPYEFQLKGYIDLGVEAWADKNEIRASYLRLAKMHHPDKNPNDPHATAKFQKVYLHQSFSKSIKTNRFFPNYR
ncbi:hypothetical protein V8C35DRAFT_297864 [Trichoderma chlorosporum]